MKLKIVGTRQAVSKVRVVDLNDAPDNRWHDIIRNDGKAIKKLLRQASAQIPSSLLGIGAWAFGTAYKASGGYYTEEIEALADWTDLSFGQICVLQCQYELAHAGVYAGSIFGCTAGVVRDPHLGLIHLRTLDWDLPAIKGATRLIRFTQGKRVHVAVGLMGCVGVLSGMVPGAYSATLNYAPSSECPGFDFGPAFLLRHMLETCDTFKEAVRVLKTTPLAAPVFFVVCGVNDAVVIERTRSKSSVRHIEKGGALAQANHHNAKRFVGFNDRLDDDLHDRSIDRQRCMEKKLLGGHQNTAAWGAALRGYPLINDITQQRMVFSPATGEVWLGT